MTSASTAPTVSVVILTARRRKKLLACLRSLEEGTLHPTDAVIIINGPDEHTRAAVESESLTFPVQIKEADALPFAEARNEGIALASGEIIALTDDDCRVDRFWLERLVDALEEHDAAGGAVLPYEAASTPEDYHPDIAWLAGNTPPGFFGPDSGTVFLPPTACLAFRRSVWESEPFQCVGGTIGSEGGGVNYAVGREDVSWWRRLRVRGCSCKAVPRAIVWHDIPASRYEKETTDSRAAADGSAYWHRERPRHYLRAAASDVVHVPSLVFRDLLRRDMTAAQSWRLRTTWGRRQLAFLEAAVDDADDAFTPVQRTGLLVSEAGKALINEAKPLLRLGIALLYHGLRRPRPIPDPGHPPRRLLIASHDFLGDNILGLPLFRQIREAFPRCEIHLLTGPVSAPLFRGSDLFQKVHVLPARRWPLVPRELPAAWSTVRGVRPDAILITYFHRASPLALFFAANAPVVMWDRDHGMKKDLWRDLAACVVPKSLRKTEVAALLDLAGPFGIGTRVLRPSFAPDEEARERARHLLRVAGLADQRFAYVSLDGDPSERKFWPLENWKELLPRLHRDTGLRFVLDGTRRWRCHADQLGLPEEMAISLHGTHDTHELAAILELARLCLGIDSGPQHVAQAVGTPAVVLFGESKEFRWGHHPGSRSEGPAGSYQALRNAPIDWTWEDTGGLPENEAVSRISVDEVYEAVCEILAQTGR